MPLQLLDPCCLTEFAYHQTKSPLHGGASVYFYVLQLVMERSSHRRWSIKKKDLNFFAKTQIKTPVSESLF